MTMKMPKFLRKIMAGKTLVSKKIVGAYQDLDIDSHLQHRESFMNQE